MSNPSLPHFQAVGRQDRPVLVVWGRTDEIIPFAQSQDVREAIPQARFLPLVIGLSRSLFPFFGVDRTCLDAASALESLSCMRVGIAINLPDGSTAYSNHVGKAAGTELPRQADRGEWHVRWNVRTAIKRYISGSMWLIPLFALLFYQVFARITAAIETWLVRTGRIDETTSYLGLSAAGARSMLETTVTLNLSFLVFTFGSMLVAIQVAGGQYTPRIIATTLLRDNVIRLTVGCFVFTLVYALRVLTRMDTSVQQFNTFIAALLALISVMFFLYLIDYAARLLRPVSLVERVGKYGVNVLEHVYPEKTVRPVPVEPHIALGPLQGIVVNKGRPGVVLALDLTGLVRLARQADGIIEFVPQMGDFLSVDEPLYRLYGGAGGLDERRLREAVVLGTERTMEQDPTFAFRILVDIAIKALSAAINDPTTAVLALDQLHRLLRVVGLRALRGENVRDAAGVARLIYRTANWEDYVHLACAEIRLYGAGSVQIMRRMRSMLENLVKTLPPHRHPELYQQLDLLDRTIDAAYALAEDRALARIGDSQGLGGTLGVERLSEPLIVEGGRQDTP